MKPWVMVATCAAVAFVVPVFLAWCVGCTPAERRAVLSANEAVCAVSHAVAGEPARIVAGVCDVELPVAEAVVKAAGDAGGGG